VLFDLAGSSPASLSRLVTLNLLLDERSGRIQGLKAASTAKSENVFKIYGDVLEDSAVVGRIMKAAAAPVGPALM
jgi:hypothetical protein